MSHCSGTWPVSRIRSTRATYTGSILSLVSYRYSFKMLSWPDDFAFFNFLMHLSISLGVKGQFRNSFGFSKLWSKISEFSIASVSS